MTSLKSWLVISGLALGVSISNTFARFAYGLILPSMQSDLSWTYTQSGWINTANALGYILGALLVFSLIGRVSNRNFYISGLILTSISLLMCGFNNGFWYLTFWRMLAGIAGAPVFILGGAMVATLFPDNPRNNALAIAGYFSGAGLGMVASGATLPYLFDASGTAIWSEAWIGLGVVSLLLTPASVWASWQIAQPEAAKPRSDTLPVYKMIWALLGYGLFATGYIVYLTFVVAWMHSADLSVTIVSASWILIGIGIIVSPFAWKPIIARYASGWPLALACGVAGLASIAPVLYPTVTGLLVSTLCFGLAVFIGPSAVTSFGRKNLPQALWAKSVSLFTLIFAIGQTIGPVAAGMIGDMTQTLSASLLMGGAILMLAALIAAVQKPLSE